MLKHNIKITSESGYKLEEIDLLEIAAHYFLEFLSKISPIDKINGSISIVGDLSSESSNEPLNGDMMEIQGYILDNGEICKYYICRLADYTNSAETLRTLAHELIHVWQTEIGKLVRNENGDWIWKGKNYGNSPYNGTDLDFELPWEKEADILDLKLVKKFYNKYFSTK